MTSLSAIPGSVLSLKVNDKKCGTQAVPFIFTEVHRRFMCLILTT